MDKYIVKINFEFKSKKYVYTAKRHIIHSTLEEALDDAVDETLEAYKEYTITEAGVSINISKLNNALEEQ